MGFRTVILCSLVATSACKKDEDDKGPTETKSPTAAKATEATKPTTKPTSTNKDALPSGSKIKWVEDDFAGALAAAKKAGLPLVVDMWAPWCHTCLSMKATVLKDPGLAVHADRFVWVALDTDKAVNAAALEKLPVSAWPTFFVLAPDESIAGRFLGSASVKQFRDFLTEGERAARAGDDSLAKDSAGWHLREGDRQAAAGAMDKAAASYAAALAAAPADWPRRADVLVSQISALYKAGDKKACAALGKEKIADTLAAKSASTADFAYYATSCSDSLEKKDAEALRQLAVKSIEMILAEQSAGLSADDRSDALRIVREQFVALGEPDKAKATALRQKKVLDEAAAAAANPFFAMTYNWPRSEVYVYLGKADELVPALVKSQADLPKEYDPPYRLAWVYSKLEKTDQALAEIAKAEKLAYGPRKGRVLTLKADLIANKGDAAATLAARKAVLAHYEGLPAGQRSERAIEAAKKALKETK